MRRLPLSPRLLSGAVFLVILASLGAGLTAFATMDKVVRVNVDGRQVAIRTFAGNVAGVLRKAHLKVGAHDTVAPDAAAPVHDGSTVVLRHGRLLSLQVDGVQRQVWVTALSVNEALDQLGLRQSGEWVSVSRSLAIPRQGLAMSLRLPQHVTVLADGKRYVVDTVAPDLAALLGQLHIRVGALDRVSSPLTVYPTDGLVVSIDRISRRSITRDVAIAFPTVHVKTSSLYVGDSRVSQAGRPGLRVNTYELTWKNHKLAGGKLVRSVVRARPIAQIVEVGTKPKPRYAPSADGLDWAALARCESGGNPRSVSANGEYRGLYQFTLGTWHDVGGQGDPIDASSDEQTYRAQILYRRVGDSAWPTCGHYLYS